MVIGIIGAGASGMAAALAAAEDPKVQVVLLERQARVGRKLLATGNGRCNLTNLNASGVSYMGEESHFAAYALKEFPVHDTLRWFQNMGLFTIAEDSGRVYPYSDQANSVVDVLRFALLKENISVKLGFEVTKVRYQNPGFQVESSEEILHFDKLIVACGGLAGTKLGGSMSGYQLLRSLGHRSTKLRPNLVQIKTAWNAIAALKGVRANCRATILKDEKPFAESSGEIQFTDYGISGPVIFEISRDVCYGKGNWVCRLDFLPEVEQSVLKAELMRKTKRDLPADELLTGILHNRLGRTLIKAAGISANQNIGALHEHEIDTVCRNVKGFEIALSEPMGMDSAQVTAGGVYTKDFCEKTMESKLVPGLYACGEVLDIDGPCGGYNLQWAWSSGRLAGASAGKEKDI